MIYLVWAPPSEGKTYWATHEAIRLMKKGRRVFSNYPIVYKERLPIKSKVHNLYSRNKIKNNLLSTIVWDKEYMYAGLHDSSIIIDEAYRDYSSRRRDVDSDIHSFFATNGHDGNDIYLIAQHYIRVDTIIREMASFFVFIRKTNNPFSFVGSGARDGELMPLFFTTEMYISEDDFKFRHIDPNAVWERKRTLFRKDVAESYNTKYFRHKEKGVDLRYWSDNPDYLSSHEDIINNDIEVGIELLTS